MFKNLNTEALGVSGLTSEIIESALSNGFKGLDLDLVEFGRQVQAQGLAKARRMLDSARLKIGSFRLPLDLEAEQEQYKRELEALEPTVDLARQLGCPRAIATIAPATDSRPYHENFEHHRRRLGEIAGLLGRYEVRLGIEFLSPTHLKKGRAFQFIQSFDQLIMLLKMLSVPNVGLALDVWHWKLGGGTLQQIQSLGRDRVVMVTLSDVEPGMTADAADEQTRRLPGETGVVDSPAVLSALADLHYDGPVTPKAHPSRLSGLGREKSIRQASAALDQVWQAAGLNPAGRKVSVATGKGA